MARFAWRGRERLGLHRIRGTETVLHSMQWNPIRIGEGYHLEPDGRVAVNPYATISEDPIERALALMDVMASDDIPEDAATDRYIDAISDLIVAK
ncbi:hypothetical protein [Streptomyces sp. NBC_00009]|uniref:hypothetical protein n=1 Tax=Streptomyces sp. NBC_00009 TaxID=2975620 RepID=UPI00324DC5CE